MAKLCKPPPPLQGTMLLAALLLLVLASIQAGPAMAVSLEPIVDVVEHVHHPEPVENQIHNSAVKVFTETAPKKVVTDWGKQRPERQPFTKGVKKGMKLHKKLCKAQASIANQNPSPDGDLPSWFSFSYDVTSASQGGAGILPSCWSSHEGTTTGTTAGGRASAALIPGSNDDGLYYVQMTGVRVGQGPLAFVVAPTTPTTVLNGPPPVDLLYLSTAADLPYTYIESGMYGRLRAEVIRQTNLLQAPPTLVPGAADDKLCYYAALSSSVPQPRLPDIAILLAVAGNGGNNAAMQGQQILAMMRALGGAAGGDAWYRESPYMICLGFRPATREQAPVLGSMIQRGRIMTVDLTAAGGTLTF